jgi:hypothetical protein
MSNNVRQPEPRRKVVVMSSNLLEGSGMSLAMAIPAWILSALVNGVILLLFCLITWNTGTASTEVGIEVVKTEVEDVPKEPDLTNTDIGLDADVPTQFNVDRLDEVSVPGPVDPTAPVGIDKAPEGPPRTLPAPPGVGGGTGGALFDENMAGTGSMFGTLGGMGGIYNAGGFGGRSGATREKLLQEGGGNDLSEAAVARGLEWLALHQASDGHWSMHEFNHHAREKPLPSGKVFTCNCQPGTGRHNDIAGTAFGVLPFLAAGQTHKPSGKATQKDYSKSVGAALTYLVNKQDKKDGFYGGDMYSHGLATIAMCEAYGLTSDPQLKASAQKAIGYIVYAQDPVGGGWRYAARDAGDTSVTGWELMALKSGQMAGLKVPTDTISKCEKYLDSVESTNKGGYSYMPNSGETPAMTAVGLLCRQYLGVNPKNPGLLAGVEQRLRKTPPGKSTLYYEYYATQVMHHMGGDSWQFWNLGPNGDGKGGIRDTMIKRQDSGSDPKYVHQLGSFAGEGLSSDGRIMTTSLSLLTLEVYYRHLPLYRRGEMGMTKDEKK